MEYAAFFFFLVLILFFLSRILTSEIHNFLYKITKSEGFSINVLAFIFFPGVVIHELSHYLTAKFLFVQTGKISFWPKKDGDYVRLGSVSVVESNFVKEFLIGVAPLVVGILSILVIVYFLSTNISGFNLLKIIISIYGIFVISNTMYASRKDFQAALPFLATSIIIGFILIILGVRAPTVIIDSLPNIDINRILHMGSVYLCVPVAIDLLAIFTLRIFNRMW